MLRICDLNISCLSGSSAEKIKAVKYIASNELATKQCTSGSGSQ